MPDVQRHGKSKGKMKYDFEKINISTEGVESLIDSWIFSERDRRLLKRVIIDGITFEKASDEFRLSVTSVKTIVYKGENILIRHI